jgi:hypothetical protein
MVYSTITQFENEFHTVLVQMFSKMKSQWDSYRIKYNSKYNMDYTSFVRYCYRITTVS